MNIGELHSRATKLAALVAHLRSIKVPPARRAEVDALIKQAETKLRAVEEHFANARDNA
jgi:hypothetical protein